MSTSIPPWTDGEDAFAFSVLENIRPMTHDKFEMDSHGGLDGRVAKNSSGGSK